jgi:gliding motility-associated lipoprotein GldH
MINQTLKPFFLLAALFVFASCNKNVVYSEYHNFSSLEWKMADKVVFEPEITDNQSLNDVSLMIRHTETYPFRNIILFVTSHYPDGKVITDTMDVMLANSKGEWEGSGAGDIYDLKVPIKKNVRFPLAGKYKFEFQHGMREQTLPELMDFGMEIEKKK